MAFYEPAKLNQYFPPEAIGVRTFGAGDVIFHQGSAVHSIYFVDDGEVHAETYLEDGKSVTFYRIFAGGALGEENLHLPAHLYTATAVLPTRVRSLAKQDVLEMTRTNPQFSMEFNACLAQRYAQALLMRELMGVKSAEDRLLTWLRWETDNGSRTLDLGGRVGTIAPQIGLSREAIYRAMGKLKEQGKIRAEGGTIDLVQ